MGGPGDRIADVGRHGNRRLFLEITVTVMRHFREKSIIKYFLVCAAVDVLQLA